MSEKTPILQGIVSNYTTPYRIRIHRSGDAAPPSAPIDFTGVWILQRKEGILEDPPQIFFEVVFEPFVY